MKRTLCLILILTILLGLTACNDSKALSSATFYYLIDPSQASTAPAETFYVTEKRQYHDSTRDLPTLLKLYLAGPLEDGMISPFPKNTQLLELEILDGQVNIHLSKEFSELDGIRLSTACACLSLTVFDLTDAEQVTITSPASDNKPAVEVTMSRANLILNDTVTGSNQSR